MALKAIWIEIPVQDIDRAAGFYSALFDFEYTIDDDGTRRTVTMAHQPEANIGVSLNQTANFEPSNKGVYVYFGAGDDLNDLLPRVEPAGGKIVTQKISMGEAGCYATIEDTEGNHIALWSMR